MKTVNINGFEVGGSQTFVIADIGSNHKQDLILAKESIDAAAESGANAVKFQSIQLNELYLNPDKKTTDFVSQLEFPEDWHSILKEYCDKKKILFFSSPTYLKAVDLLEAVDVPLYKLASAQIGTFPQIVEKVAALNKPTIFSTGIVAYDEIKSAVNIFKKHNNDQYIILHCNSIYPTAPERVNLQLINTYKKLYGHPVGFSDHTNGIHISLAAVAMGAHVIEKHFTLDRNLKSPDCSSFASDPAEFKSLVDQIRDVEKAVNQFEERNAIQQEEQSFKELILYRCVAAVDLSSNAALEEVKINFLRHKDGIDARELSGLIADKKRFNKNLKKGTLILKSDLI